MQENLLIHPLYVLYGVIPYVTRCNFTFCCRKILKFIERDDDLKHLWNVCTQYACMHAWFHKSFVIWQDYDGEFIQFLFSLSFSQRTSNKFKFIMIYLLSHSTMYVSYRFIHTFRDNGFLGLNYHHISITPSLC